MNKIKNNNEFKFDFYRLHKRYPKITDIFRIMMHHELFYLYILRSLQNYKPYKLHLLPFRIIKVQLRKKYGIEISQKVKIGKGVTIFHGFNITIHGKAILGNNINLNKNVTIGQENRGKRKGVPIIGSNVYIGINSIITGKVSIGNNVLIAPNAHVNIDVPNDSIVVGSPCRIIENINATKHYVTNKI